MLRGSNSVSARIVHSKGSDEDREDIFERTIHLEEGELDSWAEHLAKKETEQTVQRKMRRVVRVLDLKDSSNTSSVKFIHFKERLHPWNTIKVSFEHLSVNQNWRHLFTDPQKFKIFPKRQQPKYEIFFCSEGELGHRLLPLFLRHIWSYLHVDFCW